MPRNGSGTYTAPVNDWNPPVDGALIDPAGWITQLADYETAFTDSLSRSGQGGMLADLSVGAFAVDLAEIASPSNPSANNLKLYALDVATVTKLAYKDSAGTETILGSGGAGDVVGPGSATDNAIARFDSTTGKLIQNSAVTIADTTGNIAGPQSIALGASGTLGTAVFGNATSGTITLKPVTGALGSVTLSMPAATDTLVGLATTDALTNKTVNGLTISTTTGTFTLTNGKTLAISNTLTLAGTDSTTMTFPPASASIGYLNIPQNSQSAAYTTVLADSGKQIYHPGADTTARTWTIDSNANVAYAIGTAITFINDTSAGVITIAITSDTLVLAGTGTTGNRTLAASGIATAVKMTSTRWMISGTGLT